MQDGKLSEELTWYHIPEDSDMQELLIVVSFQVC
jgi:hypothetical protein